MFKKQTFILLLFLTLLLNVKSQIDTSFWFSAPDISSGLGDKPIVLYFNSYGQAATIKIRQPSNLGFSPITISIPANSIDSVNLTAFIASIENSSANVVLNNGLYISSTQKISVLYSIQAPLNREYFSLKGPKSLGKDFYIPMQEFWDQTPATNPNSFSSFEIVASQNNTTVLITPKTPIIGHAANATFTVLLQQGQTFSCQDAISSATTSLAGSIVSSNKPIAITIQSSGLNQSGCLSSVGDQITSSAYLGTNYIINKGHSITEKIFVLATQNNTQLTINDGTVTTVVMNFGENYIYTPTQSITYVKSDKPVYTFHVSGYGCRLSGAQVPPFFCAGTFTTAFTRTSTDSLALNLFTRTGFENNFLLNGSPLIPASSFSVVPGSGGNIKSAHIYMSLLDVPVGTHNVITNSGDVFGLGVLNGSRTKGSAYGYVSEFVSTPSINAGNDFTVCANGNVNLNAQIGGGNLTGIWSTNGFGSFVGGYTALTNTYIPNALDTTLKPVKLILTTSGQCPQQRDTLFLTVKPSPIVNASVDQLVCGNNSTVLLNGNVSGGATSGSWSTLGSGVFTPTNTILNPSYIPSSADTAAGNVKLILTSTNNGLCGLVRDTMKVSFSQIPASNITANTLSVCANNPTVTVTGVISGSSSTGKWTTNGSGNFNPSNIQLTTGYIPSTADVAAGQIKLYLSTTNYGNCNVAKDSIKIYFTPSPTVNVGPDLGVCKNNLLTVLSGTVSGPISTGFWSGGTGTFTPNNSVLTATYSPTASEIAAGSVNLILTSNPIGNCNAASDNIKISFINPPVVNAGADLSLCRNNINTVLAGVISGTTTTGKWSGGLGTFSPTLTALNATYTPSAAEVLNGSISLTLTSTNNGNCNSVSDVMLINFTNPAVVNAGINLSSCKNNAASALTGTVSGASTTGVWSGGLGSYNPGNSVLTATYTPTTTELAIGSVTLILSSSNNGSCAQVKDTMVINYTAPPIVNAGSDIYACKNNALSTLTGTVTGATTTGMWSGGTGTYTPNNTSVNTTYLPSQAELAAGSVNLVLSSTNNNGCSQVSDYLQLIFNNAPTVNAGVDLYVCKNNAMPILSGVVTGTTSTGIWTGGVGTYSPSNTALTTSYLPTAAEIAAGSLKIFLSSSSNGNCNIVKDSLIVFFTNSPAVNAGNNILACKNKTPAVLNGLVSGPTTTGIWSGGLGGFNPGSSVLNSTYTPSASELSAGAATLILISTNNGTCAQVKDTLIISYYNAPTINAGLDLFACKNSPSTILAGVVNGPTSTGIWTGGSGSYLPNDTVLSATYIPTPSEVAVGFANLTLTSTNNGNCNSVSDNVKVSFVPKPFANFNFNNVCLNLPTSYTDFSIPGSGTINGWEWNFGDGNPVKTTQNATHTYTSSGSFVTQLVVKNSYGCFDTIKQSPIIYPLPIANFGISRICSGTLLNLVFSDSSTVNSPEMVNQWFWDFGGPGQTNIRNPTQLYPGSGLYNVTLIATTNHNCKDTIVKAINLTPRPSAGFAYSISSGDNVGSTVSFIDTSSYANNWSWTFGEGSGSNFQNPSKTYFDNGVFVVTQVVSDSYGCTDTAKVAIRIKNVTNEITTLIPNAISPNGDGKNDVWKLDFLNLYYPKATVEIYNRWGENIYSSQNGYTVPWDGTFKGEKLPVGTYYYVLTLNDVNYLEPFKGGILLIR